jgi:anti-anti-sigma regulatory factor
VDERGRLVSWPGPDAVELTDGSLVVSATAPRAGVVVVRAVGEIDLLTAPAWRRTLVAAVWIVGAPNPPGRVVAHGGAPAGSEGGATPRLVCDLSAAAFFGATGLGVLVEVAAEATEHGVDLVVVADDHGTVDRVLQISGLDRGLEVRRRLDHAVTTAPSTGTAP